MRACSVSRDLAKYMSQTVICFVSFNNRLSESSEVASILGKIIADYHLKSVTEEESIYLCFVVILKLKSN